MITVYRAESYFVPDCAIADVIRYETETLGNELFVHEPELAQVYALPASRCMWVSKNREYAESFRIESDETPVDEYRIDESRYIVLAEDGQGGELIYIAAPPSHDE